MILCFVVDVCDVRVKRVDPVACDFEWLGGGECDVADVEVVVRLDIAYEIVDELIRTVGCGDTSLVGCGALECPAARYDLLDANEMLILDVDDEEGVVKEANLASSEVIGMERDCSSC